MTTAHEPSTARYKTGRRILTEIHGTQAADDTVAAFNDMFPDFGHYVVEATFADVYGRPGLSFAQRELLNLAIFTTLGDTRTQLITHTQAALRVGVSPDEILEAILHVSLFAGQPRAVNALATVSPLIHESRATSVAAGDSERYTTGLAMMRHIHGPAATEQILQTFASTSPDFSCYVVEAGFCDIYSRPGLSPSQRQLITIAALTTLGGCEHQLHIHIQGALNVGVTPTQLIETLIHTAVYAGHPRAGSALNVAHKVLTEQGQARPPQQ